MQGGLSQMRRLQESQRSKNWILRNHPNMCEEYIRMLCDKKYYITNYAIKPFKDNENALFVYTNGIKFYVIKIDTEWIELKLLECIEDKVKLIRNFTGDTAWNNAIKLVKRMVDEDE